MAKKNVDQHKALKLVDTHKEYKDLLSGISTLLEEARRASARSVNAILTVTYWEVGRRIVEFEQRGKAFAEYGEEIIARVAEDLTVRFGRGFSKSNLFQMRLFYLIYRKKVQTVSAQLGMEKLRTRKVQTMSAKLTTLPLEDVSKAFPLSWSHYVRLLSIKDIQAREFYETEALRGGWPIRQLDR